MNLQTSSSKNLVAWQTLVDEAANRAGYRCNEIIENYLVLTLDHFTTDQHLPSAVVAIDFLLGLNSLGRESGFKMRRVGDECLLLAGLFPERAKRKHVSVEYFIKMGQSAYSILTNSHFQWVYDPKLFTQLSEDFPNLILVLQSMRNIRPS